MIILDTNVVSELMRPEPDARVARWFASATNQRLATTSVTCAEIHFGLARLPVGARRKALSEGFDALTGPDGSLPVLDLRADHGKLCGRLRAEREAQGQPLCLADGMIAAICLADGAALATRNMRDFVNLGLHLADPWA